MIVKRFVPRTLGIVGHAQDKFTTHTESLARSAIISYALEYKPDKIISGGCHLGGIDSYAIEIARALEIPFEEFKPRSLKWQGGYKDRNLLIARTASRVLCVVVKEYPNTYTGLWFDGCYHCKSRNEKHVKSGGCYTAWKCRERDWIFI